jgi:hypothetical protein
MAGGRGSARGGGSRPKEGFGGLAGGRRSAMGGCSRPRAGFGRCLVAGAAQWEAVAGQGKA